MEVATGEYIGFVDSDDWIEPQMFEELYNAATQHNADICFSGMQCMVDGAKGDRNVILSLTRCSLDKKRFSDCVVPLRSVAKSAEVGSGAGIGMDRVYRRSLIVNNNLRFRNIRSEDKSSIPKLVKRRQSLPRLERPDTTIVVMVKVR